MITVLLAIQVASACLPNPRGIVAGPLGRLLDEHVRRMTSLGAFAGVVLVARNDTVLLHRGYGRSNQAACVPMGPGTRFDIASIAKQFTGAAILRLETAGRLDTRDSIGAWLSGVPADKSGITIHQLATHTAGLARDFDDFFARATGGTRDSVIRRILATPLDTLPGSTYSYSNLGYILLAAIVERASGMPFQRYVGDSLFARAGLAETAFFSESRRWPDRVVTHPYWDQYDAARSGGRRDSWYGLGGSQVMSSAGDLYRWLRAARTGLILRDSSYRKWTEPDSGRGYAYGWNGIRRPGGSIGIVFHSGGDTGAGGEIRYYPPSGLTVVVLTNLQHQDQLMQVDLINDLATMARARGDDLLRAGGPPPGAGALPPGRYDIDGKDAIIVWRSPDGHTWLAPEGQKAMDLLSPPDSSAAQRVPSARAALGALLDSLGSAPCAGTTDARDYPQLVPQDLLSGWCALIGRLGAVQGVDTLGVRLPGWSPTRAFIYTRVRFARGSRSMAWLFEGGQLVEMWESAAVPHPQSFSVVEETPGVLLLFDWFRGAARRLLYGVSTDHRLEISGVSGSSLVEARLQH